MKLMIHAHQLPLTPAIKHYTLQKFSRLNKYSDKLRKIQLHLNHKKHFSSAATDFSFQGNHCYLKAEGDNLYTAVNSLSVKVSQKIRELKNRLEGARIGRK